jgi:flagellar biosynthesis protein FlhB
MSDEDDGEKTEDPTPKKRDDAKKKGEFAKSQEFLGVAVLAVGLGGFLSLAGKLAGQLLIYANTIYGLIPISEFSMEQVTHLWLLTLKTIAEMLALPFFLMCLGVLVLSVLHNRFILPEDALKFDLKKLDPVKGFKEKFFSSQPFVELIKGILKLFLLGWLVWLGIRDRVRVLPALIWADPREIPSVFLEFAWIVFWRALVVGVIITIIDFSYQWYKTEQSLKMSRTEIKDEMKQQEGDPKFKAKRQRRAMEIAWGLMSKDIPTADVVVTNPTHFAVALRYRKDEADAPLVVGRGVDFLAFRIRNLAAEHDVPIVENPPLARGLYYKSRVGQMIHPDFYAAVAEILATIFRRRFGGRPRG